jgi:hypothetical protein
MMAFDEAKFRAAAKAAGYSDKEIDAELGTPAGAVSPQAISSGPETAAKFDAEGAAKRAEIVQGFEESSKTDASQSPMTLPGVLTSPVALVTGATVLGALGGYAARPVIKGIKERYMTKAPEIDRTIEIPTGGFFDVAPDATLNPLGQPTPETIDKVQRAAQLAEANRQLGIGGNQPVAPGPIARNALPTGAVNPAMFSSSPKAPRPDFEQPISTPITSAPLDAPAATPTSGPGSPTTTIINDTVKEMIQQTPDPQELRTGTGKPAFAGMGPEAALNKKGEPKFKPDYADINQVPRGFAFVPGAQYIDPGRQDLGQPLFTKTYMSQDYPSTDEMARQQASEINRMLNKPTRAELKAAGLEPAPNTPGITKKTSAGTKPVRVAGTLGALIAIPDLAKAETAGQRGMAGANLLEAVMPPGFMMSGAGEGSGAVPSFDQAMLLGSPYAQTEIAKKRRQALEYAAKVGGGRGLTPASAYPR